MAGDSRALPAGLLPGTEVGVAAYPIALEALLLRDGGSLWPDAVRVDGLPPAAKVRVPAGPAGDVPLPDLPSGAYLLTITLDGATWRSVLLRTDVELAVRGGPLGDTLAHLSHAGGGPVAGAQVWFFDRSGSAGTATTDHLGAAHADQGGGALGVLARKGEGASARYAWWSPTEASGLGIDHRGSLPDIESSAPASDMRDRIEDNTRSYDALFRRARAAAVRADSL